MALLNFQDFSGIVNAIVGVTVHRVFLADAHAVTTTTRDSDRLQFAWIRQFHAQDTARYLQHCLQITIFRRFNTELLVHAAAR